MTYNLWLAQVNYRYGSNVFIPYSVGRLWAYILEQPQLKEQWQLDRILYDREFIPKLLAETETVPDVLGISCYIWNWEYSKELAKEVKLASPTTLVVMGGPQVPDRSEDFFNEHPYVDVLVHGEGEVAFAAILEAKTQKTDLSHIPGLTLNREGRGVRTGAPARLAELDRLPSPYTSGVFDRLVVSDPSLQWQALQETNRGCPYQCTFCDWGSATFAKVNKFPLDKIKEEIKWFAEHKIELLYNCDANFGMLEQDVAIAQALIESKRKTGYPQKFRAAYAKKINERVFGVAKVLAEAEMSKGATISFQSLNRETLEVVKRSNIRFDDIGAVLSRYNNQNIPTYSELILGLPGESYTSFRAGIEHLLHSGQHYGLNVYPCMALKNSEMSQPEYVAQHGLKTVRVPMLLLHGIPPKRGEVQEYYDIIIETNTLPHKDWRKGYILAWLIQALHCGGLLERVAQYLHRKGGTSYTGFYEDLLAWFGHRSRSLLGEEIAWINGVLDKVLAGGGWDVVQKRFGPIAWPPEELTALHLMLSKDRFYMEMAMYFDYVGIETEELNEVLDEQYHALPDVEDDYGGDEERYAREVVWYGRKGKTVKRAA